MPSIQNIEISGFKAIEDLHMDLGEFNIITGRNNTGKTSFLQAINLAFNPSSVKDFKENSNDLINKQKEKCYIRCEFEKSGQSTLDEFIEVESVPNKRILEIKEPDPDLQVRYFLNALDEIVDRGPNATYYINRFWGEELAGENQEQIHNILDHAINRSVNNLSREYLEDQIVGNGVLVNVNNQEYPYFYFGNFYDELSSEVVQRSSSAAYQEINASEEISESEQISAENLERVFQDLMVPRLGKGRFVEKKPPSEPGVTFETDLSVDPNSIDPGEGANAIIISRIEDYLKKHILDGLKDFSFDTIVFEEEGGDEYQIPYGFMGGGFQSLVGILWTLNQESVTDKLIMIEEPETNMHPGYENELAHQLIDIAQNENLQIFITTHDLDLIDEFLAENMRNAYGEYLKSEFSIIQMAERAPQIIPFKQAANQRDNLKIDLRGI